MLRKIFNSLSGMSSDISNLKKEQVLELSNLYYFYDIIKCYLRYGASPNDYIGLRMYRKSHEERRKLFTFKKVVRSLKQLNDFNSDTDIVDRKEKFNKYMGNYIKRDWIFSEDVTYDEIQAFVQKYKVVIYKPVDLCQGQGIRKLKCTKENLAYLQKEYNSGKVFLLEEVIVQHSMLNEISPYSVNTVRVYTLSSIQENGEIDTEILAMYLKTSTNKDVCVDNLRWGGIAYSIDLKTGIMNSSGVDHFGIEEFIIHPVNDVMVVGKKIPHFEEIQKSVKLWCKKFPQFRYIGWDVAITEDGVEVVEANIHACTHFLQLNDIGQWPVIKAALKK